MKREELIKRIQSWNLSHDDMAALAEVIPELRESEDEATRKELIDYLKQTGIGKSKSKPMIDKFIKWINEWETITKRGNGLYYFGDGVVTHVDSPATEPPLDITQPSVVIEDNKAKDGSEDERIRKYFIWIVKNVLNNIQGLKLSEEQTIELIDNYSGIKESDILAWLEKQKDASKAIEAVDRIDKYIDENVANAHDMKDSNPDKQYYRGWDEALGAMAGILQDVYSEKENKFAPRVLPCSAAWFEDGDEKQKEQKPVEWSEEDERNLIWLCRIIHSRVVNKELSLAEESELGKWMDKWLNHEPQPVQKWDEFDEDCLKRAIWYVENPAPSVVKDTNLALWLKSLPERFNLQPKQEWSEETKTYLDGLIDYHDRFPEHQDWTDFLKSLLNPVGVEVWKQALKNIKDMCDAYKKVGEFYDDRATDFLGNVRVKCKDALEAADILGEPSWKPSEEQMEALKNSAYGFYQNGDGPFLRELYEQLKKL